MFTGLVQAVGVVAEARGGPGGVVRLVVDPGGWGHEPEPGESICVSGVCLTVVDVAGRDGGARRWGFDVVAETLAKTTLGGLAAGAEVNLERSVTPATLMGGHMVQGHVDGVATVERVKRAGEWRVRLKVPVDMMKWMTPKGSVCLDGVSLTLAALDRPAAAIEVALIPMTLAATTVGAWVEGARVNVECDMIVKTVVAQMEAAGWTGYSQEE